MTFSYFFMLVGIGLVLYGPLEFLYKKIFEKRYITFFEAIEIIKEELKNTQVTEIIRNLSKKYHDQYWINIVNMNVVDKQKMKISSNIRDLERQVNIVKNRDQIAQNFCHVDKKQLRKYIDNVLKEEKKYNESSKCTMKDESKVSELKTIDELINNKKGTVEEAINTNKISEKLRFDHSW